MPQREKWDELSRLPLTRMPSFARADCVRGEPAAGTPDYREGHRAVGPAARVAAGAARPCSQDKRYEGLGGGGGGEWGM